MPGSTPLREINRKLDLDMQEGAFWTTIGGLCLSKAGHVPVPSEYLDLGNEIQAEVVETKGARILMVRIRRIPGSAT